MHQRTVAVLADGLFFEQAQDLWREVAPVIRWPEGLEEGADRLASLYEKGAETFVLHGGDELAGAVVSAYWRRRSFGTRALELMPLALSDALLAEDRSRGLTPAAARRLVASQAAVEKSQVGTLKVTASTEPGAWYGFSFGAGWIYNAFDARKRARGGAGNLLSALGRLASDTWLEDEGLPLALRVAVDYQPQSSMTGSLVATTLAKSYFGLGDDNGGATLFDRLSTPTLIRRALTPEVLDRSTRGRGFERLHLDGPAGWVLDGRLFSLSEPAVLQVAPGPAVTLVSAPSGVLRRVSRLLGGARR